MLDKNIILELLSDFLHSILKGAFYNIILIQDNYFCLPENLTNEKIFLHEQDESPYYLISHQKPVRRDIIKKNCEEKFQAAYFIIAYNTTGKFNDQFIDELKQDNFNFELAPISLISYWLEESANIDEKLNFISSFIWDLKDFIILNKDKILRVKSFSEDIKFAKIVEIILKSTIDSLIEKGNLIKLMDNKNSWKLQLIFKQSNYIFKKLFNVFKEKTGIDEDLFSYIKNLILNKIEFKEILKIFLIAHFLVKLGDNLITSINFNSFIDEYNDRYDESKKDSIKNLNRIQIRAFSEIFDKYLTNLQNAKSKYELKLVLSLICELGDIIIESTSLKEISIEMPSFQELNIYENCLRLSKLEYFYYLPLKISELLFEFFKDRIRDLSHPLNRDDGGRIRKIADNLMESNMLEVFKTIDTDYQESVKFYCYFYKLCYGLFNIAFFNASGFSGWDFDKWIKFYSEYYVTVIKNLDCISKIKFQFNNFNKKKNEIVNWLFAKFNEFQIAISSGFFDFIKLKYPRWVQNFHNAILCPLLTANVIERFIISHFRRRPINNNFIILIDGCTLDNWRNIKKHIKNDFRDFEFEERIGFAIIPTQTYWSRRAIFAGDLMRDHNYFRSGEASVFINLLKRKYHISINPGRDKDFFNTHCETRNKYQQVKENIAIASHLPQIFIFNFSDLLEEASFDRVDVKEIIENTFYPKIKELIELILNKYTRPNIFFITDHGIIETKEEIRGLTVINTQDRSVTPLYHLNNNRIGRKSPRLVQLAPDYTLNMDAIPLSEKEKFLIIDDLDRFGLSGDRYDKMLIASSHYTFSTKKKTHGGITMAEMIIPFSRMLKKPLISRFDFKPPILKIENKEEFEKTSNILKISISNKNSNNFTNVKLHLMTANTHQIKRVLPVRANDRRDIKIYCNDKGIDPIKIKLNYYYQYNRFTLECDFKLSLEDYREEIKSDIDALLDDEL